MTEKIEQSMYNWTVNITFFPVSHQYKLNWEKILSVSTCSWIIDKSWILIPWATNLARDYLLDIVRKWEVELTEEMINTACNLHKERKETAWNIGKIAHAWAENYIKTGEMTLPEDDKVAQAVTWFLDWAVAHNVQFEISERMVYSKEHNYVWILDAIATIDWKRYLIDFKTSNAIYLLDYGMQTSAYKHAYEEETGEILDWIFIVRFSKDTEDKYWNPIPSFEIQEIVDIDFLFSAFLCAKQLKVASKKYDKWGK